MLMRLSGNPAYNQNPPALDKELVTRSSLVCGGGKLLEDEYNLGLHVVALFVVLTQSSLGRYTYSLNRWCRVIYFLAANAFFFLLLLLFHKHSISLRLSSDFQ